MTHSSIIWKKTWYNSHIIRRYGAICKSIQKFNVKNSMEYFSALTDNLTTTLLIFIHIYLRPYISTWERARTWKAQKWKLINHASKLEARGESYSRRIIYAISSTGRISHDDAGIIRRIFLTFWVASCSGWLPSGQCWRGLPKRPKRTRGQLPCLLLVCIGTIWSRWGSRLLEILSRIEGWLRSSPLPILEIEMWIVILNRYHVCFS